MNNEPKQWNAKGSEVYELTTGKTIARTDIGGSDETTEANAKLIAAAPELLELANQIVLANEAREFIPTDIIKGAEEAIRKATE